MNQQCVLIHCKLLHASSVIQWEHNAVVCLQGALAEAVSGVYCGWASLGSSDAVYKTALSIGWNPFYNNEQKTAEPWLLHDFDKDFYGADCPHNCEHSDSRTCILKPDMGQSVLLHLLLRYL